MLASCSSCVLFLSNRVYISSDLGVVFVGAQLSEVRSGSLPCGQWCTPCQRGHGLRGGWTGREEKSSYWKGELHHNANAIHEAGRRQ